VTATWVRAGNVICPHSSYTIRFLPRAARLANRAVVRTPTVHGNQPPGRRQRQARQASHSESAVCWLSSRLASIRCELAPQDPRMWQQVEPHAATRLSQRHRQYTATTHRTGIEVYGTAWKVRRRPNWSIRNAAGGIVAASKSTRRSVCIYRNRRISGIARPVPIRRGGAMCRSVSV